MMIEKPGFLYRHLSHLGWLAHTSKHVPSNGRTAQGLRQADRRRTLSLSEGSWRDRGDYHVLPVRTVLQAFQHGQCNFGFALAVEIHFIRQKADFFGQCGDCFRSLRAGYGDIGGYRRLWVERKPLQFPVTAL